MGSRAGPPSVSVRAKVERAFPGLVGTGYELTSPIDPGYNCIAWAAGDSGAFWWPAKSVGIPGMKLGGYYWPPGIPNEETLAAFVDAFRAQGYGPCGDGSLQSGYEKIAIYVGRDGAPTHASRQLPSGKWASKLGPSEDIEHDAAEDVSGEKYGTVARFMRREISDGRAHPRAQ